MLKNFMANSAEGVSQFIFMIYDSVENVMNTNTSVDEWC